MNLSSWKRMVTVLAISGSSTPFQNEDSIRHVPWSLSKSCLARSVVAALASPSGERGPEQAPTAIMATNTNDTGSHLIITSLIACRVGRVFEAHQTTMKQSGGPRRLGPPYSESIS